MYTLNMTILGKGNYTYGFTPPPSENICSLIHGGYPSTFLAEGGLL